MSRNDLATIRKLQTAINAHGGRILVNRQQFYSEKQKRPVNMYSIKHAYYDEDKEHTSYIELFASVSQIQIVLFLRDYWYKMQNMPIPTDNPIWEEAKRKYAEKHDTGGVLDGKA